MKKPNHSNDNEGQNYDPATGKYISDSGSATSEENPVDKVLLAPGIQGDFTEEFWKDFVAAASEGAENSSEAPTFSEEDQKIVDAMVLILKTDDEKKEFISRLNSLPDKMRKAYKETILGHDKVPPLKFNVLDGVINGTDYSKSDDASYNLLEHSVNYTKHSLSKYGAAMEYECHPAWELLFHEIGHAVDRVMYRTDIVHAQDYGSVSMTDQFGTLYNSKKTENSIYDMMVKDVKSVGTQTFVKSVSGMFDKLMSEKIKEVGVQKTYDEARNIKALMSARAAPVLDFLTAYAGGEYKFVSFKNPMADAIFAKEMEEAKKIDDPYDKIKATAEAKYHRKELSTMVVGHHPSYWKHNKKKNASTEAFAELSALAATDKEAYEALKKIIPSAISRYEKAFEREREMKKENENGK